jgi:hypothetical protein
MNKILGIIILSLFTISCSSNLDFDQVNDLKTTPVIVANLATFDVPASQFVVGGVEQTISGDLLNFDVFQDNYFNNSLVKADLYFEINNTINRAYKIDLYFLDDSNNTIYTIPFNVPAYTGTQNLVTKTEVFQNSNLDLLKKTKKIGFVVTMFPGPALTANSTGSLKLRSSATVYLNQQ